jgi:tripartite ATP-independent transporter DctP family solute receptor
MKKVLAMCISVLLVMSLLLTGCSGQKNEETKQAPSQEQKQETEKKEDKKPEKVVKLKMGHVVADTHPWQKGALKFAELVAEKTNNTVQIEVFSNSTLGNDRDLVEGMQMGSVDFALVAGVLGNFYEGIQLLELPYLFENQDHLRKVIYGPVGEEIKQNLQSKAGIIGLEFWERGPRQLTTNKAINSVEDIQGLKIRVPEIPPMVAAWKAMGANPTPMAFGELYTALQQHIVDAQENPFVNIATARFDEVQSHLAVTEHVFGYVLHVMSEKTYNKLTPEQQKAIREAAKEAMEYENKIVTENEGKLLEELKSRGMQVTYPDKEGFKNKARTVHQEFADKYGKDLYEKIINAAK